MAIFLQRNRYNLDKEVVVVKKKWKKGKQFDKMDKISKNDFWFFDQKLREESEKDSPDALQILFYDLSR